MIIESQETITRDTKHKKFYWLVTSAYKTRGDNLYINLICSNLLSLDKMYPFVMLIELLSFSL